MTEGEVDAWLRETRQEFGDAYFDHALDCEVCNRALARGQASRSPSDITEDPEEMCLEGLLLWEPFELVEGLLEERLVGAGGLA